MINNNILKYNLRSNQRNKILNRNLLSPTKLQKKKNVETSYPVVVRVQ